MKAMEAHPDNPEIQEIGARTLGMPVCVVRCDLQLEVTHHCHPCSGLFASKDQVLAVLGNVRALVDQVCSRNTVVSSNCSLLRPDLFVMHPPAESLEQCRGCKGCACEAGAGHELAGQFGAGRCQRRRAERA